MIHTQRALLPSRFSSHRQRVLSVLAAFLALVLPASTLQAANAGYATYYVPADQENMRVVFEDMAKGTVNDSPNPPFTEIETQPLRSIVGITSWADNVQVYIDHWEDGYGFDPDNPAATADETCNVLNLGDQLTLESSNVATIPAERNLADNWTYPAADCAPVSDCATPATANGCYYDGRDKIISVGGAITLTRAIQPESVTDVGLTYSNPALVQAVAWEVYPVQPQLTTYILPFGEDLFTKVDGGGDSGEAGNYASFERVAVLVQATEDGTTVELDLDNDGTFDSFSPSRDITAPTDCTTVHTLNEGDVLLIDRNTDGGGGCGPTPDGSLDTGTRIEGSGTLQVQYVIGDPTADYWEIRGFSAFPRGFWDSEYYAPVDEDAQGDSGGTDVYLHNPGASAITIDWQDNASSGSFSVGAGATESFVDAAGAMTVDSSTYFTSRDGEPFWGISTVDSGTVNYDWGYSLVPAFLLEDEYFIGFAPARIPPAAGDDDDGIYLAPVQDNVRIFVDYDADGVVDDTYDLDRLDTQYVTDAADGDMSGAQIFATGRFIAAFGENAANTTPGAGLDLGYTTLPSADWIQLVLDVEKAVDPVLLGTGTGEITQYSITVSTAEFDIEDLRVVDQLAAGWAYCDTATTCPTCDDPVTAGECPDPVVTFPDGSTSNNTPSTSGQDVTWDSTRWTGGQLDMAPNQEVTIVYYAYTTAGHADGSVTVTPVSATAERNVGTPTVTQTFTATDSVFNTYTTRLLQITKASDVVSAAAPGDTVEYTVTVGNGGTGDLTDVNVYDDLPDGTVYVPASVAWQAGYCAGTTDDVEDGFGAVSYTNNDGSASWLAGWSETDPVGGGAAGGFARVRVGELALGQTLAGGAFRDEFATAGSYAGSDGSEAWSADWAETDDLGGGAVSGYARVTGGSLVMSRLAAVAGSFADDFASGGYGGQTGSDNWSADWAETDAYGENDDTGPGGGFVAVNAGALRFQYLLSTVRDEFSVVSWGNNDGTDDWAADWVESDPGGQDDVHVENGVLEFDPSTDGVGNEHVTRTATVGGATSITLDLDWDDAGVEPGEGVRIQYSTDGTTFVNFPLVGSGAGILDGNDADGPKTGTIAWTPANATIWLRILGYGNYDGGDNARIDNVELSFNAPASAAGTEVRRAADVAATGATTAALTFDYTGANLEAGDTIVVQASSDGVAFTTLATFDGVNGSASSPSYNLNPYISATTTVRFLVTGGIDASDETWDIDNVNLAYASPPSSTTNGPAVVRGADLSAVTTAVLSFDYAGSNLEAGDTVVVEVSTGGPFTVLGTLDGAGSGSFGPYDLVNPTDYRSATTSIRLRVTGGFTVADESIAIDNVDITVSATASGVAVERSADLDPTASAILSFDTSGTNLEAGDTVVVEVSTGGPFTVLGTFDAATGVPTSQQYNLVSPTDYRSDATTVRFRATGGFEAADESFEVDNVDITYTNGVIPTFTDPPNLLSAAESCTLPETGSLTLTLEVTLDDPFPTGQDEITNRAEATSNEILVPVSASVTDPVIVPSSQTATVGDLVWLDADGDGVKDVGENGLANVEVTLKDQFGTPVGVTTTDANGIYQFTGVAPGSDYFVAVTGGLPAGLTQTTDSRTDDRTDNFDLVAAQDYEDADLGYRPAAGTAILGDRVWSDADADGNQDPGEPGLSGVTVRLYPDTDGDGLADDTAVDLVAGGLDLDGDGAITAADDGVMVDNGGTPRTVINGRIDLDGDGSIESNGDDDGSVNLGGTSYTVDDGSLSGGTDPTPAIPNYRTAVTVGNGLYSFTVAASGSEDYLVHVDDTQPALAAYSATTQVFFSFIDVPDGASFLTADVGVVQDAPGTTFTIQDRVWLDDGGLTGITADGVQNGDEAGIAGVTVDLLDASGNVIATTTTDAAGDFTFTGVPGGVRYSWQVTDAGGVLVDYYGTTSWAQATVYQMPGPLAGDVDHRPAPHFGYNYVRSIGDTVFNDFDGNGIQDPGEPGIGGVEVKLYSDAGTLGVIDGGDAVIATVTTDANGKYLFSGLVNSGTYLVSIESPPAGFTYTGMDLTPALPDMTDSDPGTPGQQNPSAVGAGGESDLSNDFPYQAVNQVTISGRLWEDDGAGGGTAEDGVQDPGESGFENVTVDLYTAVEVIDGRLDIDNDGDVDIDDDGTFRGFTVIDGYLDMDGDGDTGVPDSGDDGTLAGFAIVDGLVDWNTGSPPGAADDDGAFPDVVYLTTTTDANGDYSFVNVPGDTTGGLNPPDYIVIVTDATGVLSGYDTTFERTEGTTGPWNGVESIIDLIADVTNVDYGYYSPPVLTPITLASLDSWWTPDGLAVEWTTETETRNAGFHLYGRPSSEAPWQRLTGRLIPSRVIDSLAPQRYGTVLSPGVHLGELLLEDWDTRGERRRHGPFAVGRLHGFDAVAASEPIDWGLIRATNTLERQRRWSPEKADGLPEALLWVSESGVQRIGFDALQGLGVDFSGTRIAELALSDRGAGHWRQVIDADGDGLFGSGDSVEFAARVVPTLYSSRNAYRLWVDPSQSSVRTAVSRTLQPRNAVPGVFPDTVVEEQELAYTFASPTADPWYEEWLFAYGSAAGLERPFDLPGYAGGDAILRLSLFGVADWPGTDADHHLRVLVNGTELLDVWFDGSDDASQSLILPQGLLTETGNTLLLEAPGDTGYDYDIQALDGFRVDYERFTVADTGAWRGAIPTGFGHKIEVVGFEGQAVAWKGKQRRVQETDSTAGSLFLRGKGDWRAADGRAIHQPDVQAEVPPPAAEPAAGSVDYLVVSHPLFIGTVAMDDLLALQQTRGYTTEVVDVETLYAAYSDFEVEPEAIRKYLSQARPRFTLLVGGDSYDYHDYLGLASQSFIPTYYAATDDLVSFAPADSRYVDYSGNGVPQASLGRLPVRTEEELTQVVAKLWTVEIPSAAVLASGPSDSGRQFAQVSEGHAAALPESLPPIELKVDDLGLETARDLLIDELNLGQALVSYVGHSSYRIWGLNPSHGILLWADEARALTNASPNLVAQWGCWNTYFVNPLQDTMANGFLFQEHGAAAVLGATALTDVAMLREFGAVFFDQVGRRPTLGEALLKAHRAYVAANPGRVESLAGFALLGDPATPLR